MVNTIYEWIYQVAHLKQEGHSYEELEILIANELSNNKYDDFFKDEKNINIRFKWLFDHSLISNFKDENYTL